MVPEVVPQGALDEGPGEVALLLDAVAGEPAPVLRDQVKLQGREVVRW